MRDALGRRSNTEDTIKSLIDECRRALTRAIVFINKKGGAGKTSITANAAAVLAQGLEAAKSPKKVLLMQFDHQGDQGLDLGFKHHPEHDDGESLISLVRGKGALHILRDIRPNLDVVPAGESLKEAVTFLKGYNGDDRKLARLRVTKAIADIANQYEWIIIDTPPGDEELQLLGMMIAQWIVVPISFDLANRYGIEGVDKLFMAIGEDNPDIDLLGVQMFNFARADIYVDKKTNQARETGQRARLRRKLEADLQKAESEAPVFDAVISSSPVVAETSREYGLVAYEVADKFQQDPAFRKELRAQGVHLKSERVEQLAVDYEDAVLEMVGRVRQMEAEEA